jgi:hypothetical protein
MGKTMAAILAATALTLLPVTAAAEAPSYTDSHYDVAITPVYNSSYPYTGKLELQIFTSGTVRGFYSPQGVRSFVQVNGGRDGDYIWFDIGPAVTVDLGAGVAPGNRLHIVATVGADGTISGQAWPNYFANGLFSPDPQFTNPQQHDQYLFSAKPVVKTP